MSTPERRFTPSDLWSIPRVGLPCPSPDGTFVVVGVTTYREGSDTGLERLYLVPTTRGATPRPLTSADVSASEPALSPDGRRLAFTRAPKEGAPAQLYVLPLDGGEPARLTDLPLGVADPRWTPDGSAILVLSNLYREALDVEGTRRLSAERAKVTSAPHVTEDRVYRFWDRWITEGEATHIFLVDAATGASRDLTPTSHRFFDLMDPSGDFDVSPDGREIAFSANATQAPYGALRAGIFTLGLTSGAVTPLKAAPEDIGQDRRPRYSPDGHFLVYGARPEHDNYADRVRIARVDRATGAHAVLTEAWDLSASAWEFVGPHTLLVEVDERGHSSLYRLDIVDVLDAGAASAPELVIRGGSLHGARASSDGAIFLQHARLTEPPEVGRFRPGEPCVERITSFTASAVSHVDFGAVEELDVAGAGGEPVHVILVFPPGHDRARAAPLVHVIHGGPYGMHADGWHWRWNAQLFAARGYVVALVNFHGSSGYGQRFANDVLGDWGGKPAEDILLATDVLVARGIADGARLAIAGGSYGGYLACWLPTRTDRFACTVVHAPVYDTLTLAAGDVTQGLERELGGEPWDMPRARDRIDRWNPAVHTEHYRTPTLVTHGERDFRCPVQHGLELYGMLKAKGVPARLAHYPDEAHWIRKRRNSIHWYGEVLGWLQRHLDAGLVDGKPLPAP